MMMMMMMSRILQQPYMRPNHAPLRKSYLIDKKRWQTPIMGMEPFYWDVNFQQLVT